MPYPLDGANPHAARRGADLPKRYRGDFRTRVFWGTNSGLMMTSLNGGMPDGGVPTIIAPGLIGGVAL